MIKKKLVTAHLDFAITNMYTVSLSRMSDPDPSEIIKKKYHSVRSTRVKQRILGEKRVQVVKVAYNKQTKKTKIFSQILNHDISKGKIKTYLRWLLGNRCC